MSLSSINLLWQHRFRGLMAVGAHSVADDGAALLIRPDEFERRTYQVLNVLTTGEAREACAISVETIAKFEGLADGRLILGMTDDDIYIFRDGKKVRFMADRRVTYTDVSVAPEQGWFICSFSDSIFSTHGAAFGDANARLGWTRDLTVPVNRVAASWDGLALALGLADGRVLAQDNMRRPLWEFAHDEPISALAMPRHGARPVAGTEAGTVLAFDEDGGLRWRSPVGSPVLCLATDASAEWVVAAASDGTTHSLVALGPDGALAWDYQLDAAPTGLSLSPNGFFLLVSLANGSALHFSVDFAASALHGHGARRDGELEAARAAREEGDLERAHAILTALIAADPHDAPTAGEWLSVRDDLLHQRLQAAREQMSDGRWDEALEALAACVELDPWSEAVFSARRECREGFIQAHAEAARERAADGDLDGAELDWRRILEVDPSYTEARGELALLRAERAAALVREGDERHAAGDVDEALAMWQQALRLIPDPETEERLRRAEVERCVAAGAALYEAGRLPEAVFQLKKALSLDPAHEEAQRYLGYAQGQTSDSTIADRFARLE